MPIIIGNVDAFIIGLALGALGMLFFMIALGAVAIKRQGKYNETPQR